MNYLFLLFMICVFCIWIAVLIFGVFHASHRLFEKKSRSNTDNSGVAEWRWTLEAKPAKKTSHLDTFDTIRHSYLDI